jgi:predicted MPP superfamily phosphohydrolase
LLFLVFGFFKEGPMSLGFVFQAFDLHLIQQLKTLWVFILVGGLLNAVGAYLLFRHSGTWRLPIKFSIVTADFLIIFAVSMILLPVTGTSYGNPKPVTVVFAVIFLNLQGIVLLLVAGLLAIFKRLQAKDKANLLLWGYAGSHLLLAVILFYAFWIEPAWVDVTYHEIHSAKLAPGTTTFKVVEISDIHMERWTNRESSVLATINQLQPDLILLAGDYINIDYYEPTAYTDIHRFFQGLHAKYGVYAVQGVVDNYDGTRLQLPDTEVQLLENEQRKLVINGQPIYLVGISATNANTLWDAYQLEQAQIGIPDNAFKFLLYHTPDLAPQANANHYAFYFAGHTHGGQIDLPFYGAVFTSSSFGRKYAAGLYNIGQDSQLYVTRGLGFEGGNLPRARFLARPEISVFTFSPSN